MGSNESKTAVTPKLEPNRRLRNERLCQVVDPRSPSTGIHRTPIQVGAAAHIPVAAECQCPPLISDPRSPSPGVYRTPMKDVMRATVSSFAQRLSMLFLNDGVDTVNPAPPPPFPKIRNLSADEDAELNSSEPLLPQCSSPHAPARGVVPVGLSPPHSDAAAEEGSVSLPEQVEMGVEATQFLDEGDGADPDVPLKVELSSSLLTCHDGLVLSPAVTGGALLSLSPPLDTDTHKISVMDGLRSVNPDSLLSTDTAATEPLIPSTAVDDGPAGCSGSQPELQSELGSKLEAVNPLTSGEDQIIQTQTDCGPNRMRIPTFDTKSPSQVVFKPQWLGVGFGMTGVRPRGVQCRAKGVSPLSQRNGQRADIENKGQLSKQKQRERCGKVLVGEVRSPLQILKETNSPRERTSQMKLKSSTPDRSKLGQMDRRVLSVAVDKENQR